ncbi:MAG: lipopolysaccharide kinase InaA family protein [Planctomycetota bacterium]
MEGVLAEQVVDLLERAPREGQLLRRQPGRVVRRVTARDGLPVILKTWVTHGFWEQLRRRVYGSGAEAEWAGLHLLDAAGIPAPRPLGRGRVRLGGATVEVVVSEDLGPLETATRHASRRLAAGQSLEELDRDLIELTRALLRVGLVDTDHGLHNVLLLRSGALARIDLEQARRSARPREGVRRYGGMLGALLASYVFAVQPEVDLAVDFAERLQRELRPPLGAVRRARRRVELLLERQRARCGIDTRVPFSPAWA